MFGDESGRGIDWEGGRKAGRVSGGEWRKKKWVWEGERKNERYRDEVKLVRVWREREKICVCGGEVGRKRMNT